MLNVTSSCDDFHGRRHDAVPSHPSLMGEQDMQVSDECVSMNLSTEMHIPDTAARHAVVASSAMFMGDASLVSDDAVKDEERGGEKERDEEKETEMEREKETEKEREEIGSMTAVALPIESERHAPLDTLFVESQEPEPSSSPSSSLNVESQGFMTDANHEVLEKSNCDMTDI